MAIDCDVVVVGAGAAGLAACAELRRQRPALRVICLEASSRIGGRIYTRRDPASLLPVELGAEFVHGRPPELFRMPELLLYEHTGEALYVRNGKLFANDEALFEASERLLARVKATSGNDRALAEVLNSSRQPRAIKHRAQTQLEGFNAARKELLSVASLLRDAQAAERIEGDRAFRVLQGYDTVPHTLAAGSDVRLSHAIDKVEWRKGGVTLRGTCGIDGSSFQVRAAKAIFTVSLAARRGIVFDPVPQHVEDAFARFELGRVFRITFRFADRFWEKQENLRTAGFLIAPKQAFPTWWTTNPVLTPLLTGWAAGPAADALAGLDEQALVTQALHSLRNILGMRGIPRPQAVHFHDWSRDPLFGGAYSYVKAGGLGARAVVRKPVDGTLYFAGEATAPDGAGGTVHGAIASGIRAARQASDATLK